MPFQTFEWRCQFHVSGWLGSKPAGQTVSNEPKGHRRYLHSDYAVVYGASASLSDHLHAAAVVPKVRLSVPTVVKFKPGCRKVRLSVPKVQMPVVHMQYVFFQNKK